MLPDLQSLITLQQIETAADRARRAIDAMPQRRAAVDEAIAERQTALGAARARTEENQAARRAIERDLAGVQSRLSKYRDQLMAVKTNKEYQAVQHEIATAAAEVKAFEDQLLDRMLEAEDLAADVRRVQAEVTEAERNAVVDRAALDAETATLTASLERLAADRAAVAAALTPSALTLFEYIRGHRGDAVVEARDGHCSACYVRLRPHVSNQIRRADSIIQCDSCQRILFAPPPAPPPAQAAT